MKTKITFLFVISLISISAHAGFGVRGGGKTIRVESGTQVRCIDDSGLNTETLTCNASYGCEAISMCEEIDMDYDLSQ